MGVSGEVDGDVTVFLATTDKDAGDRLLRQTTDTGGEKTIIATYLA